MALVKWNKREADNPWRDLGTLQQEINDLFDFDRFTGPSGLFDRSVSPALDVIEGEDAFTVICELPGMEHKDIDITMASNVLTIKGERRNEEEKDNKGKYFKKESWSGNFQRTLSLPATVDAEKIEAKLKNGVLYISIPKKEEAKPKQISVKVS